MPVRHRLLAEDRQKKKHHQPNTSQGRRALVQHSQHQTRSTGSTRVQQRQNQSARPVSTHVRCAAQGLMTTTTTDQRARANIDQAHARATPQPTKAAKRNASKHSTWRKAAPRLRDSAHELESARPGAQALRQRRPRRLPTSCFFSLSLCSGPGHHHVAKRIDVCQRAMRGLVCAARLDARFVVRLTYRACHHRPAWPPCPPSPWQRSCPWTKTACL